MRFPTKCSSRFFSHDSFPVQVGPFEERGIWGEVWMVDKPTGPKKGEVNETLKWQMNSQMINCTFVSLSITLTELTRRRKVVTSITMVECATVISGDQMIKLHVKKKITNSVSKNQYSLNKFHIYRPYNFQSCTLVELRHWTDHKQSKIQFFSKYALKNLSSRTLCR